MSLSTTIFERQAHESAPFLSQLQPTTKEFQIYGILWKSTSKNGGLKSNLWGKTVKTLHWSTGLRSFWCSLFGLNLRLKKSQMWWTKCSSGLSYQSPAQWAGTNTRTNFLPDLFVELLFRVTSSTSSRCSRYHCKFGNFPIPDEDLHDSTEKMKLKVVGCLGFQGRTTVESPRVHDTMPVIDCHFQLLMTELCRDT